MKFRKGFVSNSSSSSFIIGFKKIPTTVEEVKNLIFPHSDGVPDLYFEEAYSTWDLSAEILNQIRDSGPLSFEEMVEIFNSGYPDMPEFEKYSHYHHLPKQEEDETEEDYRKRYREFREAEIKEKRDFCSQILEQKLEEMGEEHIFVRLVYSDDTTKGATMEHSRFFSNLPGFRVSHH